MTKTVTQAFTFGPNDVALRFDDESWAVISEAMQAERMDDAAEWLLKSALNRSMWRAMCEQDDSLADRIAIEMNRHWPIAAVA